MLADADPNPPTITAKSPDLVSFGRYGLITSQASVLPRKLFATAEKVSTSVVPINLAMAFPTYFTKNGITFKKYKTEIKAEAKTIRDKTLMAKTYPSEMPPNTK